MSKIRVKVAFLMREKTAVTEIYSRIQDLTDSWLFKHSYLI
jgi:serine/threonine protein kinase